MHSPAATALAALIILAAAFVRGYSGFGFALVGVAGISLLIDPNAAVPIEIGLEVLASLLLLPPVWREIRWRPVLVLLAGAVALTPVGALFLIHAPADVARIGIAVVIAVAALALLRASAPRTAPGTPAALAVGGVAGLLNGAFGTSGPPIVLFFVGTQRAAAVSRASMMACFLVLDAIALASYAAGGLIDRTLLTTMLWCLPALVVGSWLGHRAFHGSDQTRFRTRVLWILVALAALTGARGLAGLL
ncbi:MAG: sulfite exporter TauE/SafE family protein [Gaiellales bacterium]